MVADSGTSPPTRASLKAWWKQFQIRQKSNAFQAKKNNSDNEERKVFGVQLKDSLRCANVQISTANKDGEMYVWGYIPVVVAKCGLYLKEKATETEGIFRINGSAKRMRELQAIFEAPPRYGKGIDWKAETYTNHDVASVFRRYLVMMPEPVVPSSLYHEFRSIYRSAKKDDDIVQEYKRLIRSMPRPNQYLLLYVLDLLSVFSRKADKNLMTASNLAVIFRPGILAHRDHDLAPAENELSTQVLEFLIDHQDWFMLEIPPLLPDASESSSQLPPPPSISHPEDYDTDVQVGPSSDDDRERGSTSPLPVNGGWKLIHRRTKKRGRDNARTNTEVGRSKSQVDHTRPPKKASSSELSPVNEASLMGATGELGEDVVLGSERGASVGRRRTLPSDSTKSRGGNAGGGEEKRSGKVLKKKKEGRGRPVSLAPPPSTH